MKKSLKYLTLILITTLIVFGCIKTPKNDNSKSIQDNYKEIRDDLYTDNKGNIYFKTVDSSIPNNPVDGFIYAVYSDNFGIDGIKEMKKVLDTVSFQSIGSSYFRDKNHIYYFYEMSDGGTMSIIDEANLKTFKVLKYSNYAIDSKSAFYRNTKIKGADISTFETIIIEDNRSKIGWYAKDKKNYYNGYDIMAETEMKGLKEEIKWFKIKAKTN